MSTAHEPGPGLDRRGFLRRAAATGAVAAWATPTIQSLAAPAYAVGSPAAGCSACLTGGGRVLEAPGAPVVHRGADIPALSFGLGQLCCAGDGPVRIEVTAHPGKGGPLGGGKKPDVGYLFTDDLVISCTQVAGKRASAPGSAQCPSTFAGTAQDRDGNTLSFTFQGNGDAGRLDAVSIRITDRAGTPVLSGAAGLDRGNLQAHADLGPARRDCTGC